MAASTRSRPQLRALLATAGLAFGLMIAPNATQRAAAAGDPPTVQVSDGQEPFISAIVRSGTVQFLGDWSDDPINITIDDVDQGNYSFNDCSQGCDWLPVNAGSHIVVSDGTITKQLTVTNLSVLGVDSVASTIDGTSSPGRDVEIQTWGDTLVISDDGSGTWIADFGSTLPFDGGAQGWASQTDDDGDQTWAWWSTPRLHVQPDGFVVGQGGWYEGDPVEVETFNPDGVLVNTFTVTAGSRDIDQDSWGIENVGEFGVGYTVIARDHQTSREHEVRPVTIDPIDTELDIVSGTTTLEEGDTLSVAADYCNRDVTVTNGVYTADFSVPGTQGHEQDTCDLGPGSWGDVIQFDNDGDFTILWWNVPQLPSFSVETPHSVSGYGEEWPDGTVVDIIVSSDADPITSELFTTQATVTYWGPNPWDQGFDVYLDGQFDIQPGHFVTVMAEYDGENPGHEFQKQLEVANLSIDDPGNDTGQMSGHAPPDSGVNINLNNSYQNAWRNVTARPVTDADPGYWSADLANLAVGVDGAGTIDVPYEPGTHINVEVRDDDGDATRRTQNVPQPRQLEAYPGLDAVLAWGSGEIDLDLTVTRDSTVAYTDTSRWGFQLWQDGFDLLPDDVVTVSDGETTKDHVVAEITVDPITEGEFTATGTGPAGQQIGVNLNTLPDGPDSNVETKWVTVESDGTWTAPFGTAFAPSHWVEAVVFDGDPNDNDQTHVLTHLTAPWIMASLDDGSFYGEGWPIDDTVLVTIDDPVTPEPVDDTVVPYPTERWGAFPWETYFNTDGGRDLRPGFEVTATTGPDGDGTPDLVKTLTVVDLTIDGIDPESALITGHTEPDLTVYVNAQNEFEQAWRNVIAEPALAGDPGFWSADLSTLGPDDDGDGEVGLPLASNTGYAAQVFDEDGDATNSGGCYECDDPGGGPGELHLHAVVFGNEWVHGEGLPSGTYVVHIDNAPECRSLVHREGAEFHVDGNELCDDGDLQPGHHVMVSTVADDGSPDQPIADFTIDGVVISGADVDTDEVWGLATDGKPVTVALFDPDTGEAIAWRTVDLEPGIAEWSIDFSTAPVPSTDDNWGSGSLSGRSVWAAQFDAQGHTESDWIETEPHLYANRITDVVALDSWPTGEPITLEVFASDAADALSLHAEYVAAPGPYYVVSTQTGLGGFDLLAGHHVVLTAGSLEIAHSISAVGVTSIDFTTDSYDGIATAEGSMVRTGVWYEIPDERQEGFLEFEATSSWTADFTDQGLDFRATNRIEGFVAEVDDGGNATFYDFAAEYEELTNNDGTATNADGDLIITGLDGGNSVTVTENQSGDAGDGYQTIGTPLYVSGSDEDGNPIVRDFEAGEEPLILTLRIFGDEMPGGLSLDEILVFRDGIEVPNCPAVLQRNSDFPCVSERRWIDGDVKLTIQTLAFSTWTMAFRLVEITAFSAMEEPIGVGTPVDASGAFEVGGTEFTAMVDWGDGNCSVVDISDREFGTTHEYALPGVYAPRLEVYAGSRTCTEVEDEDPIDSVTYQFVVVYDPDGGFVTGGGWIDSPTGAYTPDPELTGRADFGFVAKYKRGQITPDGNTNFQFQVAGLHFRSTSYDWLVISGEEKAKYKGDGTINSEGDYGFMLTAMDREDGDSFRIKIWDNATGDVVYDNWSIDGDDGNDGTALGGGSIIIHTAKK